MENKPVITQLPLLDAIIDKVKTRWQAFSPREKILLNVMFWTLILVGCWIFVIMSGGEQKEISVSIKQMEKQIQDLEQAIPFKSKIEEQSGVFTALLDKERQKFYTPEEIDTYKFGGMINDLLKKQGLRVKNYKTVEINKRSHLEFTVSGSAYNFFSFLYKVSTADKYWRISRLSMKNENLRGELTVIFRITYEQMAPVAD